MKFRRRRSHPEVETPMALPESALSEPGIGRLPVEADLVNDRQPCMACRGTGRKLTTNDLLREMLSHLPEDPGIMDAFVQEFYRRLTAADERKPLGLRLAPLFPADLVTAGPTEVDSKGKLQRDRLLRGLVEILTTFDPEHPDSEAMQILNTHLGIMGRSHTNFLRPDGSERDATPDEYLEVRDILFSLLRDGLGGKWRLEYGPALLAAYHYAMVEMMHVAQHSDHQAPRFVRHAK